MATDKDQSGKQDSRLPEEVISEEVIDLNLIETFPASDPPSWTLGVERGVAAAVPAAEPDKKSS